MVRGTCARRRRLPAGCCELEEEVKSALADREMEKRFVSENSKLRKQVVRGVARRGSWRGRCRGVGRRWERVD